MKTQLHFAPRLSHFALVLVFLATLYSQFSTSFAQGTAFTYQGRLNDGGNPANGRYDLRFILYTADPGGSQAGPILTNSSTTVNNGLFTTSLDFGSGIFAGGNYWLEISVRTNGSGSFATLNPRQKLAPAPCQTPFLSISSRLRPL